MNIFIKLRDKSFVQDIVTREHFGNGKSLRQIERDLGIGKTTFQRWCQRHNIKTRTRIEAAKLAIDEIHASGIWKGEGHWAYGLTKETSQHYANCSNAMKENNPCHLEQSIKANCIAIQKAQLETFPEGEKECFKILETGKISSVRQFIISPYVCDFAFVNERIIVEIDGAGSHFTGKDVKRDIFLAKQGWTTLRRAYGNGQRTTWNRFVEVLNKLIPNGNFISPNPTISSFPRNQYGMVICQAYTGTRIKFKNPDDPAFIELLHGCINRHISTSVS